MSIFGKVKQFLGIGTLSVKLTVPPVFNPSDASVKGTLNITAKSDQSIEKIDIKMEESYSTGKGDSKTEKKYTLGEIHLNDSFSMKQAEVKSINFELPFKLLKSENDQLKEKGGVLGGLGKMGSFLDGERSEYSIIATVDVKGASLDPNDIVKIQKAKK